MFHLFIFLDGLFFRYGREIRRVYNEFFFVIISLTKLNSCFVHFFSFLGDWSFEYIDAWEIRWEFNAFFCIMYHSLMKLYLRFVFSFFLIFFVGIWPISKHGSLGKFSKSFEIFTKKSAIFTFFFYFVIPGKFSKDFESFIINVFHLLGTRL